MGIPAENRQKGTVPLPILVGIIAIIAFFLIAGMSPFKSTLLNGLFPKPNSKAAGNELTVNVANKIRPFTNGNLGVAFVNWEHAWGKPYPGQVPGLAQALKASHVGMFRYAGGLWANWVGFDPAKPAPQEYTNWTHNGMTYSFNYGTDEIDSLQNLAQSVSADIMIQVNISNNDPDMWSEMVRYANAPGKYKIKYWEMGNELDLEQSQAPDVYVNPQEYGRRMVLYMQKMLAVDPTIKFVGAAQAYGVAESGNNSSLSDYFFTPFQITKNAGRVMDGTTYHWYSQCNSNNLADILRYRWYNSDGTSLNPPTLWNNHYSRYWADVMPPEITSQVLSKYPGITQGITELNFDACNYENPFNGNHINALWFSDVIGRLAYHGVDYITAYTGYSSGSYSQLYADDPQYATKIMARPSYYAFLMYGQFFGDQMVESHSYKDDDISIWASTDSKDPGKLKLRVTNLTASDITTPVNINGFSASDGKVYILRSDNPTDVSTYSVTEQAPTFLNGEKINAMDVMGSLSQIQPGYIVVNGSMLNYTFPAYSTTALILNEVVPGSTPVPIPSPTPTPTPRPMLVTDLTLVNASNETGTKDIRPIKEGDTLDLNGQPFTCMNIRANINPTIVGSVVFDYDGTQKYQVANDYPYYIGGVKKTDPVCWMLTNGSHTLTVTPYLAADATSRKGTPLTYHFTVVNAQLPSPASGDLTIYDGSSAGLASGWGGCSYNDGTQTTLYNNTSPTYSGKPYSIKTITPPYQAFAFCPQPFFKTGQYGALDFWVQAGGTGASFSIIADAIGQPTRPEVGASSYIIGGDVSFIPGKWEHVVVPFKDLNIDNQEQAFRFYFIGKSGANPPPIYFGKISFIPRNDGSQPVPTPPNTNFSFYDPTSGSLAHGYGDHSHDAAAGQITVYNNTSPVRSGQYSIKVINPPWQAISMIGGSGYTTGYKSLDMWVQSAGTGNPFSVWLGFPNGSGSSDVDPYIFEPDKTLIAGKWEHISIPLSKLNACNNLIGDLSIIGRWDALASPPPFYIDQIFLVPGNDPGCPAPSTTPVASTSAIPGDIDSNNKVDIFDYNIILTNFGKTGINIPGDIDKNGKVDIFDYNNLLTNFGKTI